jgi:hypothetical protein
MPARAVAAFLALTSAAVAAPGETGAWKTFKSWSVGCDNTRSCTAAAGDSDRESGLALALSRSGEPEAQPTIRFALHFSADTPRKGMITLSAGGRSVARIRIGVDTRASDGGLTVTAEPVRAAILAALRKEAQLQLRFDAPLGEDQRDRYSISLDGAAAALLWMDERQKRVGTATALIRPGRRPASAVPPPPPLPRRPQAVPLPQGGEAATLSAAARERIESMREEGCEEDVRERDRDGVPTVRRLPEGRLLVSVRCAWGASSTSESYFILRDGESPQIERARFPRPYEPLDEGPAERMPEFVLADVYDGALDQGEITSGDGTHGGSFCGERGSWVWTGARFEPIQIRTMLPCGGANVPVPLYRTR